MMQGGNSTNSGSGSMVVRKKRSLMDASSGGSVSLVESDEPFGSRARKRVLSTEVETLRAELEFERSLRALDNNRFEKTTKRLERKVEFSAEEVKEAKSLMDEMRKESERHIEQMRDARKKMQMELRECQIQLEGERAQTASTASGDDPKVERLERELHATKTENEALKEKIDSLREELKQMLAAQQDMKSSAKSSQDENENLRGSSSTAPCFVFKELNKVRIQLVESEQKNQELRTLADDMQKKAEQLIQERDTARSATSRVEQVEKDLRELSAEHEKAKAAERFPAEPSRPATLSKNPKNLYILWEEYEHGIGGRKAAKSFTSPERGRVKSMYHRRKVFWDMVASHIRAGSTARNAIERVYEVYGKYESVTKIIRNMLNDRRERGGHPNLIV